MKDYLETFNEDISLEAKRTGFFNRYHTSIKLIHKPTGITYECFIDEKLLHLAEIGLKEKLDQHYEKRAIGKRFSEWLKDRCTPTAEMFGDSSNIKKDKKPLHPGSVAIWLLCDEGYEKDKAHVLDCKDGSVSMTMLAVSDVARIMDVNINKFSEFICEVLPVDYSLAYKLVKLLPHTSMDFWMDLQERYDRYMDD